MQQGIKHTWHFDSSPEDVWAYLTRPELLEQWLAKSDIRPIVGHRFQLFGRAGSVIACEVLEVEPFTRFSYSWRRPSAKDGTSYDSRVVWTLTAKDHGTELQLVHDGFIAEEDLLAHDSGWWRFGNGLVELLKAPRNANA